MTINRCGACVLVIAASVGCGKRGSSLPPPTAAAAARFLETASFGPTPAEVAKLQSIGYEAWLDNQFNTAPSAYDDPAPTDMDLSVLQQRFFVNALTGDDQLRQRTALALGQIFVVSGNKLDDPRAFAPWLRLLSADAFGTYAKLLRDVTLSPAMGVYLDMVNNDKPDPVLHTTPNENYAREVLQLFSIGLSRLNPDGTPMLDATGAEIATYGQPVIEGFAHVFTGWTFAPPPGVASTFPNDTRYDVPMQADEAHHDSGEKLLLRGERLAAGRSSAVDLFDAIDNIVRDPNLGPFVSFRLIQRLVKSNPTPAYVGRVAGAFAGDGKGARGDLKAVLRAILLDPEALGEPTASGGKLREPVLLVAGLLRALGAHSDGAGLADYAAAMRQRLFYPTSVFNYYPPTYRIPGSTLLGPEYKLRTGPALLAKAGFVNDLVSGGIPGTKVDYGPLVKLAADPAALAAALDALLLRGRMSAAARTALVTGLASVPDPDTRARSGVFLVATSSQYEVQP